ncbi:nitrate ABC transporter, permease protein [Oxalicibacterium flavum]|uniref:Nitrate ABC transporter, permease protein n=1 Tax=Oxalicibacterium flavum TaxID=179467 RepID=A0A8J2UP66_9BURK|nr:ABC transporter permease subunit [Oxalicibacterium flavum]GGC11657.1 nitrate ABC transporter, permease protein [Oxalicibacterium flavum]
MKTSALSRFKSPLLSLVVLLVLIGIWHIATLPTKSTAASLTPEQIEYARLMGKDPEQLAAPVKSAFPTPADMGATFVDQLRDPFYDNGPNDKGIGIQIAHSLQRVGLGFVIGMSPLVYRVLDPFIQLLKPISPLAWMPIALYTIKDASLSGIFVIFICSIWPMLINTAFGVAGVRRDWLNVASTLEVSPVRKAFEVILPAAAPTILTGMRISMGIAWLVIVAAEMLVGGTGIGYFVWNEWNNLSLTNVIFAILMIGAVGMVLDLIFAKAQKAVTYAD